MNHNHFKNSFNKNVLASILHENSKIEAIKYVIDHSNYSLKEAKDIVERISEKNIDSFNFDDFIDKTEENKHFDFENIQQLLSEGKKIEAIKLVKDYSNLGLAEAKDYVEMIENSSILTKENLDLIMNSSTKESTYLQTGSISRSSKGYKAIYRDEFGNRKEIIPSDPEWENFKKLMRNNEMVDEYERKYQQNPNDYKKSTLFVEENNNALYFKIAFVIALIALMIYFFI